MGSTLSNLQVVNSPQDISMTDLMISASEIGSAEEVNVGRAELVF